MSVLNQCLRKIVVNPTATAVAVSYGYFLAKLAFVWWNVLCYKISILMSYPVQTFGGLIHYITRYLHLIIAKFRNYIKNFSMVSFETGVGLISHSWCSFHPNATRLRWKLLLLLLRKIKVKIRTILVTKPLKIYVYVVYRSFT